MDWLEFDHGRADFERVIRKSLHFPATLKNKALFPIQVGKSFCYFYFKMGLLRNQKFESTFSYGEDSVS